MYLAMHTVITMNPQPCSTWLSIATHTLSLKPSISQRTASVTADSRISRPAPYLSNSLSDISRKGTSLQAEMK